MIPLYHLCAFRDFFGAPDARHDDGVMWLLLIRGNVTRMALIKLLVSLDSGEHVNIPGVDIFPVTAVKISVSIDNTSYLFVPNKTKYFRLRLTDEIS